MANNNGNNIIGYRVSLGMVPTTVAAFTIVNIIFR